MYTHTYTNKSAHLFIECISNRTENFENIETDEERRKEQQTLIDNFCVECPNDIDVYHGQIRLNECMDKLVREMEQFKNIGTMPSQERTPLVLIIRSILIINIYIHCLAYMYYSLSQKKSIL